MWKSSFALKVVAGALMFVVLNATNACGDATSKNELPVGDAASDGGDGGDGSPSCVAPVAAPPWLDAYLSERMAKLTGAMEISPGVLLPQRATAAQRQIARDYLLSEMSALGLTASLDDYGTGANVVGRLAPTSEGSGRWIVVGAHYDGVSAGPGANDNASGVAAVLAVARALRELPCRNQELVFVMFDEEEGGLVGSRAFALRERRAGTLISAVHTVDQVGWDVDKDLRFEIESPTPELLAEYQASAAVVGAVVVRTDTTGSDHEAFRERGYAAAGVTEEFVGGDTSPHAHASGDTAATIDRSYQALAVRLVTHVVARELGAE